MSFLCTTMNDFIVVHVTAIEWTKRRGRIEGEMYDLSNYGLHNLVYLVFNLINTQGKYIDDDVALIIKIYTYIICIYIYLYVQR